MPKKYLPEQIEKILQNLPEELKEAVFSMETADAIWEICSRQGVLDERMTKIAECVGYVLMGLLTPEDFQETLEKEVKLKKDTAKKLAQEINRFIFYPVKPALEQLYKMEISPSEKPSKAVPLIEEPKIGSREDDRYRETVE